MAQDQEFVDLLESAFGEEPSINQPDEPSINQPDEPLSSPPDEPSNQNKLNREFDNPQALSIQWLDFRKIARYIGCSNISELKLDVVIEKIVSIQNETIEKLAKKRAAKKKQMKKRKAEAVSKSEQTAGTEEVESEQTAEEEKVRVYLYQLQENTTKASINPYQLKTYTLINSFTSKLSKSVDATSREDVTSHRVIFFYVNEDRIIFALTSNHGFQVVKQCVDYTFPMKVVKKIGNPQNIVKVERRCLFGDAVKQTLHLKANCDFTSYLYHLVEVITSSIKINSSLARALQNLPEPQTARSIPSSSSMPPQEEMEAHSQEHSEQAPSENKTKGTYNIRAHSSGILRINKRLAVHDYPRVLNLLVKYMRGERTVNGEREEEEDDTSFSFLDLIGKADLPHEELDKFLIKEIFKQYQEKKETEFFLRHIHLDDFQFANAFKIKFLDEKQKVRYMRIEEAGPPTLEDILLKINNPDETKFSEQFLFSKLKFDKSRKYTSLIACIEGQLFHTNENTYYKLKNGWYQVKADHIAGVNREFKNLIRKTLIERNTVGFLPQEWLRSMKKEEQYNRSYQKEPHGVKNGYLVFDEVFSAGKTSTTESVEFCDVLKFTRDTVYLYHVKPVFKNSTRDATSQIRCAAEELRSSLSSKKSDCYLQRLWVYATSEKKECKLKEDTEFWAAVRRDMKKCFPTSANFINLFVRRKIVFVYAFLKYGESKSILDDIKEHYITPESFTFIAVEDQQELFDQLVRYGYLDSLGDLTGKFYYMKDDDFKLEGKFRRKSTDILTLLKKYRLSSNSLIARLELLQIANDMKNTDYEFQIVQIDAESAGEGSSSNTTDNTDRGIRSEAVAGPSRIKNKRKTEGCPNTSSKKQNRRF